jgi:hypothetical protein
MSPFASPATPPPPGARARHQEAVDAVEAYGTAIVIWEEALADAIAHRDNAAEAGAE